MRTRGLNFQQILLGLALLAALVWNLAHAAEIRGIQLGSGATGTRAEVHPDLRDRRYAGLARSRPASSASFQSAM